MGNAQDGVLIDADASDNTVGGTVSGAGNVLSGNGWRGVELNTGAEHNLIEGNLIGTDVNGAHALSNGTAADHSGISVIGGANDNTIGGTTAAARNIISANTYDGVHIYTDTSGTVVEGNFIGTDVTGTYALGNGRDGVEIDSGSDSNTIGGSASGDQNIISGNTLNGVRIDAAARNVIAGDEIGANVNGGPLPNGHDGVLILDGAAGNTIGGNTAAAGDLIAYNLANGVELNGAGKGNLVEDDTIDDNGDNPSSTSRGDGVLVDDSPSARVTGCTIESNRGWGILVTRSSNTKLGPNTVLDNGLGNVSG
jgi:titin